MSGKCAGVSANILEKNAKPVRIQALYVFMSASKVFLEQQKALNRRQEVHLQRLSDTQWACQYAPA